MLAVKGELLKFARKNGPVIALELEAVAAALFKLWLAAQDEANALQKPKGRPHLLPDLGVEEAASEVGLPLTEIADYPDQNVQEMGAPVIDEIGRQVSRKGYPPATD